jgi:hypothetical protein
MAERKSEAAFSGIGGIELLLIDTLVPAASIAPDCTLTGRLSDNKVVIVLRELFADSDVICVGLDVNALRSDARDDETASVNGIVVSLSNFEN